MANMYKIFLLMLSLFFIKTNLFGQQNDIFIKAGFLYESEQNILVENKGIHVKGNQIAGVLEFNEIPQDAHIIDLTAYTVLPGLIDAHTHVLFSQDADKDFSEHSIKSLTMESDALRTLRGVKRAKSYLDVGITSIKDLGNSGLYLDVALRDAINEGTIEGPRIFASGPFLAAQGGQIYGVTPKHQDIVELEYRVVTSVEDAKNAVREHVNQKVDIIKIGADNLPNQTFLTIDEMKSIVNTAHSYGLTVTAHAVTNQSVWNAVKAGVDGIEHGFVIADTTLTLMAEKDVFLVPTENSRTYMKKYAQLAGDTESEPKWVENYIQKSNDRLLRAIKKGVPIIAGSDNYTNLGVTPGQSSKDMFSAYFDAGMKPLDILYSATYLSAHYLNKEDEIGVIKPQSKADIIAVKGNIESDFVATMENVVFVMKNGKVYFHQEVPR